MREPVEQIVEMCVSKLRQIFASNWESVYLTILSPGLEHFSGSHQTSPLFDGILLLARIRDLRFLIKIATHLGQNKRLARPAGHVLDKALVEELASVLGVERLRLLLAKGDQGAEEKK